jgi:hypothetical protein
MGLLSAAEILYRYRVASSEKLLPMAKILGMIVTILKNFSLL